MGRSILAISLIAVLLIGVVSFDDAFAKDHKEPKPPKPPKPPKDGGGILEELQAQIIDLVEQIAELRALIESFTFVQSDPAETVLEIQIDPQSTAPALVVHDGTDDLFVVNEDGSIQIGSNTVVINPDGTVTGEPLDLPVGSSIRGDLIATEPGTDTLANLTCDPNQVARWTGIEWVCSTASIETLHTSVITGATVGGSLDIALGDIPVMSFFNTQDRHLSLVRCGDTTCSQGNTITVVDSETEVGTGNSLAIGAFPVIAYNDGVNFDLKLVRCGNDTCSSGNVIHTVDSEGRVGLFASLALAGGNIPRIAYVDHTINGGNIIKIATCTFECGSFTIHALDSPVDNVNDLELAMPADGLPVISYAGLNDDLKVIKCGNIVCSSGNTITNVAPGSGAQLIDMALTTSGIPVIIYRDTPTQFLKMVTCGNVSCSSGNIITTIVSESVFFSSIALTQQDFPVIVFGGTGNFPPLKILNCGDTTCTSGNKIKTFGGENTFVDLALASEGNEDIPVIAHAKNVLKLTVQHPTLVFN